jgi:hypothetical protein
MIAIARKASWRTMVKQGGRTMKAPTRLSVEPLEDKTLLSSLAITLKTNHPIYKVGQAVVMTLTETNVSRHDVQVSFGPSVDGFSVTHGNATVWRSNSGIQPLFIVLETLAPGKSLTLSATWVAGPSTGTFVAHNELIPRGPVATFRVVAR